MSDVDAAGGVVRATVEVALPVAEAFRVFTDEVGAWYVVDRHTVMDHRRTVDIRFEPHVGGRFLDVYDAATGEGREMGRVTAWDPPRRLVLVDDRATETEVTFAAVRGEGEGEGDGAAATAVTIEQRGLDRLPDDVAEHVRRHGWPLLAGWFADAVSGRREERTMTPTGTSDTTPTDTTPAVTLRGVSPYLFYADAGAGLDWLSRVFGFVEEARYVDADGVVRESEIRAGDTTIQLCGHEPGQGHGEGLLLIVHVDDVDAQHARVVAAGVDAPEPEQKTYGVRTFSVTDPWGYTWDFWQPSGAVDAGDLTEVRAP